MARDGPTGGRTRAFVFCLVWALSLACFVAVASASSDACLDILDIVDCWRKRPDPPYCNTTTTPLMQCAEQARKLVEDCDDGNFTLAADITLKVYKARDDAICYSSKLRGMFRSSAVCWNQAKSCTQHITFSMPKNLPFNCTEKSIDYYECKKRSPENCYYYMERLFRSMYKASPCCATASDCSLRFILSLLTISLLSRRTNPPAARLSYESRSTALTLNVAGYDNRSQDWLPSVVTFLLLHFAMGPQATVANPSKKQFIHPDGGVRSHPRKLQHLVGGRSSDTPDNERTSPTSRFVAGLRSF